MRIFIITMDDPVQTYSFIKSIIDSRTNDIVGLAIAKGDRLSIQKNKSKYEYILSLLLIMGFFPFLRDSFITLKFKVLKKLSKKINFISDPSILLYAKRKGILTFEIKTPNNKEFLKSLRALSPDVIINQSQSILKSELLSIPTIGVINRHNALLPRNRGRLTPFWVLYKGEKETGVSIHFVTEEIDAGDIIVQEKFEVNDNDNFNSLVRKNYIYAPKAMLKALEKLESGANSFIKNDSSLATYNTTPSLSHAWQYRKNRLKKFFKVA